jgi:hypothetical protein
MAMCWQAEGQKASEMAGNPPFPAIAAESNL